MSAELFPLNVARLTELGIKFTRRPGSRDLKLKCLCGGRLILDNELPWHVCVGGDFRCPARSKSMTFDQLLDLLKAQVQS
jgi:hypothetical protein